MLAVNSYSIFDITNYDLALLINSNEVIFNFNRELFDRGYIEKLSEHYMRVVRSVIRFPGTKASELDILSEEDKAQILKGVSKTETGDAGEKTIEELGYEIDFDFR